MRQIRIAVVALVSVVISMTAAGSAVAAEPAESGLGVYDICEHLPWWPGCQIW